MKVSIVQDSIVYKNNKVKIDNLFDEELYKYTDSYADRFYNETYGTNEVFNNLIQYRLAIKKWFEDNTPSRIELKEANDTCMFFAKDLGDELKIPTQGYKSYKKYIIYIEFLITVFASAVDIMLLQSKIRHTGEIKKNSKFAVVRHKGAIKKFRRFSEIEQEIETLYDKKSIYRLFPLLKRWKWVVQAFLKSYRTFNRMSRFYCSLLGEHFKYPLMRFYKKRIVYAELYQLMLDDYMSNFKGCDFYTGNNLDRYSVIEDQICQKYDIKSYCIPHGIEYGFKFPKGFSCDVFYVHSQYTADYLNKLYDTQKYVYDESVIRRMFEYNYDKPHEQMVIFFTEPREVNVNQEIITALLPKLKEEGIKLYLKLHPGDNKGNYDGYDVEYITDYDLSMSGNICISRKSTILIEAIYNHSVPVAIITNQKDNSTFNIFPSLNAKEIIKTYSVDELFEVIMKHRLE